MFTISITNMALYENCKKLLFFAGFHSVIHSNYNCGFQTLVEKTGTPQKHQSFVQTIFKTLVLTEQDKLSG